MLVLTRRAGESIVIGDEIRVVVLDVRGDTVRLGIEAPRTVQVHRAEVYAEVQAANAAAVTHSGDLESLAGRLARIARPARQTRAAVGNAGGSSRGARGQGGGRSGPGPTSPRPVPRPPGSAADVSSARAPEPGPEAPSDVDPGERRPPHP